VGKPVSFLDNLDLFLIMDVICVAGQCLHLTQKEVQRSPVLTRLEADGAFGAVPLPFHMKFLSLWKYRVVEQGLSADELISVIEVRQKLSHFLTRKLCLACCHQWDLHWIGERFQEVAIDTRKRKLVILSAAGGSLPGVGS
jgi:hypothetical protein